MLEYIFSHSVLGLCAWDLPALILLVVMAVVFLVHRHKQKKRENEFEDQLSELLAAETVDNAEV